jgi:MoaA/NifB/PqqE/SkfB family radical SAM enzyme
MNRFDLKVGFACNNNCVHCVVADKRDTANLSTAEIKEIIDSIDSTYYIVLTGGEPSIRPDFIEILQYAREQTQHRLLLQTNGTGFADPDIAREAVKYLDYILIAIHSSVADVHDQIVQSPGMFAKTMQGLQNILTYRQECSCPADIGTQTVISKLNMATLPETFMFLRQLLPTSKLHLTFPHPNGNANSAKVVPRYSEIKPYIQQCLEWFASYLRTEAIPACYLYPYQELVDNNEDAHLLQNDLMVGIDKSNANAPFFDKAGQTKDYGQAMLSDKRKISSCQDCIFDKGCCGVWKEYLELYKDDLDLLPIKSSAV